MRILEKAGLPVPAAPSLTSAFASPWLPSPRAVLSKDLQQQNLQKMQGAILSLNLLDFHDFYEDKLLQRMRLSSSSPRVVDSASPDAKIDAKAVSAHARKPDSPVSKPRSPEHMQEIAQEAVAEEEERVEDRVEQVASALMQLQVVEMRVAASSHVAEQALVAAQMAKQEEQGRMQQEALKAQLQQLREEVQTRMQEREDARREVEARGGQSRRVQAQVKETQLQT